MNNKCAQFSVYDNPAGTSGRACTKTIAEIAKRFQNPVLLLDENNGQKFNLTEFGSLTNDKGSLRWPGNAESIHGIILYIDEVLESGLDVQDILKAMNGQYFIAHTTWSSTPENPRVRFVILFNHPISATLQSPVFDYFNEKFDGFLDPTGRSPVPIYHLPAHQPNRRSEYRCFIGEGEFFDPEKAGIEPASTMKHNNGTKAARLSDDDLHSGVEIPEESHRRLRVRRVRPRRKWAGIRQKHR